MVANMVSSPRKILLSMVDLYAAMVLGFCSGDVRYVPCPCRYFESGLWDVGEHDETLHHDEHSAEDIPQFPEQEESLV